VVFCFFGKELELEYHSKKVAMSSIVQSIRQSFSLARRGFHTTAPKRGMWGPNHEKSSAVGKELNLPPEVIEEPHLHLAFLKVQNLYEKLNIKDPKQQEDLWKQYELSPGFSTLEWVWPSPPPFHTYEELPLVRELDNRKQTEHH